MIKWLRKLLRGFKYYGPPDLIPPHQGEPGHETFIRTAEDGGPELECSYGHGWYPAWEECQVCKKWIANGIIPYAIPEDRITWLKDRQ